MDSLGGAHLEKRPLYRLKLRGLPHREQGEAAEIQGDGGHDGLPEIQRAQQAEDEVDGEGGAERVPHDLVDLRLVAQGLMRRAETAGLEWNFTPTGKM